MVLTLILVYKNDYKLYKGWNEITYSFYNLSSVVIKTCEWATTCNFIPYFTGYVITYSCQDEN